MSWQIKIEDLSKMYRLGEVGTGSLVQDLNRFYHKIRGKEDPYAQIAAVNDRTKSANSDFVWALRDINFEVAPGDVLGIVGRNGAGKSTLLKVLSRITSPTTGSVKTRGRIASLLEVGTGMHPEMTARENIYLNGAILGMTKKEIQFKFDEIVDFSGCAMYIDTPLKRYSSGMRVRLGFAVAAFLEPEILVVDEVLAVGDADFQNKAIGKMKDISKNSGRTVLFVSHNMIAVKSLCTTGLLIENGTIKAQDTADNIVDLYLEKAAQELITELVPDELTYTIPEFDFVEMKILPAKPMLNDSVTVKFVLQVNEDDFEGLQIAFDLVSSKEVIIFGTGAEFRKNIENRIEVECKIPSDFLNTGSYYIDVHISTMSMRRIYSGEQMLSFEVFEDKRDNAFMGKIKGLIRPNVTWKEI